MTIVEALKLDSGLSLKKTIGCNRVRCMRFHEYCSLWVIEEKRGSRYLELLETESEELAVAKLLEDDDVG